MAALESKDCTSPEVNRIQNNQVTVRIQELNDSYKNKKKILTRLLLEKKKKKTYKKLTELLI